MGAPRGVGCTTFSCPASASLMTLLRLSPRSLPPSPNVNSSGGPARSAHARDSTQLTADPGRDTNRRVRCAGADGPTARGVVRARSFGASRWGGCLEPPAPSRPCCPDQAWRENLPASHARSESLARARLRDRQPRLCFPTADKRESSTRPHLLQNCVDALLVGLHVPPMHVLGLGSTFDALHCAEYAEQKNDRPHERGHHEWCRDIPGLQYPRLAHLQRTVLVRLDHDRVHLALTGLFAQFAPEGPEHVFSGVPTCEAGQDNRFLRRIDFGRHVPRSSHDVAKARGVEAPGGRP